VGVAGSKLVAKVASEKAKPDGLLEVAAGNESAFLAPLTIGEMPGIGRKTEGTLRGLGINTIGKLAEMPRHPENLFWCLWCAVTPLLKGHR
jgi:DNA polymerase-4